MKLSEAFAALERGEEVEYIGAIDSWRPLTFDSGFMLGKAKDYQFRLKPKPVEPVTLWVNFYFTGSVCAHPSKESAECAKFPSSSRIAVPFREVVPLTEEERDALNKIKLDSSPVAPPSDVKFLLDLLKKQGVE